MIPSSLLLLVQIRSRINRRHAEMQRDGCAMGRAFDSRQNNRSQDRTTKYARVIADDMICRMGAKLSLRLLGDSDRNEQD